jgi:transcriptional regulator with AAA-type ATPase domain
MAARSFAGTRAPLDLPFWSMAITTSPFVGRQRELAALRELLKEARAGVGAVAMLSGEPGIGKTTTARAFDLLQGRDR